MTMPAYNSFQLYKGDTLQFTLTLNASGSAYSIPGGSSFSGSVKEKHSTSVTAEFDTSVLSSASGVVLFTLPATESSLLDAKKNWVYDLQLETVGGVVTTLLAGSIFVTDQVTP
jgi:hypothetical protein